MRKQFIVKVIETHKLHIEANSIAEAKLIACDNYIWDGNLNAPDKYTVDLDVKEADSAKLNFFKAAKVDFDRVSNDEEDI